MTQQLNNIITSLFILVSLKYLRVITSRTKCYLPILGNTILDVHIEGGKIEEISF